MNSIHTVVRVRRIVLPALLILVLSLSVLTGCGKSGDDSKKSKPKNSWDEMRWDEGEWGAIESRPHRISIA